MHTYIYVVFVLLFWSTGAFAQPSPKVDLTPNEKQWLANNQDIIVGGSPDWTPFNFTDVQGQYRGIANDYLQLIAKNTGFTYRVISDVWEKNLARIQNNEVHILGSVYKNAEREQYLNFSKPYFEALDYFFARKDIELQTFDDLNGKRLALPKGYAHRKIIETHFPKIIIVEVDTFGAAIDAVLENNADLLFDTYGALVYTLEMEGINTIVPFKSTRHIGKNPIHIVSNKIHPELASIIQKGLDAITPEQHQRIANRWFKQAPNEALEIVLSAEEKQWISQHPIVEVASSTNFPPFDFVDIKGEQSGFTHDLLMLIAPKVGIDFRFNSHIWTQAFEKTLQGENHLLPAIYQNNERNKFLLFSDDYFESIDYFYAKPSLNIKNNPDLASLTVAIVKGYASEKILRSTYPDLDIVFADELAGAIELVLSNKADLVYDATTAIQYQINASGIMNLKAIKPIENAETFSLKMAVTKHNSALISILNKAIALIEPSEKIALLEKWQIAALPKNLSNHEEKSFELSQSERQWITEHPVIQVAGDYAWMPFDSKESHELSTGVGQDLISAIGELTGLKFQHSSDGWERSLSLVQNQKKDLLVAAFKYRERESQLKFSTPYIDMVKSFFIRDNLNISSLDELSNLRLAIVRNSAMEEDIKKYLPKIQMVFVASPQQAIDYIIDDKADVIFDSLVFTKHLLRQKSVTGIVPFKTLPHEPVRRLHIAVRKDFQPLINIINKALIHINENSLNTILDKWFNSRKIANKPRVALTEQDLSWLSSYEEFSFIADPNWMPYESVDENGKHQGMLPDYLDIIAKSLDIKFSRKPTKNWQESARLLASNQVNIGSAASGYAPFKNLVFTDSFISSPFVIVMDEEEKYIDDISKLLNKRITLIADYASTTALINRFPQKSFQFVNSAEKGLDDLSSGKTDVFISSLAQVNYLFAEKGYNALRVVGKTKYTLDLSFAIQPELAKLVPIFNKVLASISTTEKQQILKKWGDQALLVKTDYQLIFIIVGIAALIILIVFLWNRKLQAEIILRKQTELTLKQVERNLSVVIDNMPVIIYVVDAETGLLVMANLNAVTELGIDETILEKTSGNTFYQGPTENINDKQIQINTLGEQNIEGLLSIIPISYQHKTALLHIIVNINERIAMETDLKQAKDNAESASKAKSEFLANMSHEIRTPMNAIIGFTELLQEQIQDNKLKSFVKTIQSAGNSLLLLINDILDLSKIEAGKLSISKEVCNPHSIFEDISNIFTMNVRSKGLDFMLEVDEKIPQSLLLDSTRIRQILFNLVGNAVKFTDKGCITLRAAAENENTIHSTVDLRIDVEDTGIGIPADKVADIFESFQQQEGQSVRKYGGTGLGLTISRRLTELMNGKISVTSEVDKGSCFSVYLRSVDVSAIESPIENVMSEVSMKTTVIFNSIKVLIVDDIEDNRNLLAEIFNTVGIEYIQAKNGLEAVELASQHRFDLIIMDIRMPEMDGYQAAMHIKEAQPDLPIVALTASVMRDDYERQRRENFSGYLRKPVLKEELINELKKHLSYVETQEDIVDGTYNLHLNKTLAMELKEKYLSQCEQLKHNNNLSDIAVFAQALLDEAQTHDSAALEQFANELIQATDIFDIVKIKASLTQFLDLFE